MSLYNQKIWAIEKYEMYLEGHISPISCITGLVDYDIIVTGSADRTIRIWSFSEMKQKFVLKGHGETVNSVFISNDASQVFSASSDKTCKIWDLFSKQVLHTLPHPDQVSCIAVSEFLICTCAGIQIFLWDKADLSSPKVFCFHQDIVKCVRFSQDNCFIFSGARDNTLHLQGLEAEEKGCFLSGHTDAVICIDVSEEFIATGSEDRTVKVWGISASKLLHNLQGHTDWVSSVAITKDQKEVISGSWDNTIRIWNLVIPTSHTIINTHNAPVTGLCLKYPNCIVSCSMDRTIQIYNRNNEKNSVFQGHSSHITCILITDDSKFILSIDWECRLKLWDTMKKTEVFNANVLWNKANNVVVSKSGKSFMVLKNENAWIGDVETNQILEIQQGKVRYICMTPSLNFVVGQIGNSAVVWRLK